MSETLFSRRHRYEDAWYLEMKPDRVTYGWTFKFNNKRYRVYVFDDRFSLVGSYGIEMTRLFIVKLGKSKQIVMKDIINMFEPCGKPTKAMRGLVRNFMVHHLKQHLGL